MRWPVMLYVPNLIGYARVLCMWLAFYFARTNHRLAIGLYLTNFAGDAVDGLAARWWNQSSKYGAVLDMVTDRVSTAGLCAYLAILYPPDAFLFVSLIVIDIMSHWFHVVAAATAGVHHKSVQTNAILKLYYGCYPVFAFCCLGQELYYLARWWVAFEPIGWLSAAAQCVLWPGLLAKQVANVAQMWDAANTLASIERLDAKRE